jgi:hypothetical protein
MPDNSATSSKVSVDGRKTAEAEQAIATHTRGLKPGWYILDGGFFWHSTQPHVVAGPFSTQADAMTARVAVERLTRNEGRYFIDKAELDA